MQNATRIFSGTRYQLCIGVVIGFTLSLCLNEIFRDSIIIRKIAESGEVTEATSAGSVVSTIPNLNRSRNENVRVLCWVMTCPNNHRTKAIHVKRTWGKRCDKLLFFSSHEDSSIDSIAVPGVGDDHNLLWRKTKFAMKYAWEHHRNEFDWIMKTDDDTYVIVENLKKFLSNYSPSDPIFFGCQFRREGVVSPWASGGAGYVLSKEALRRFVLDALPYPQKCKQDNNGPEDLELGQCLARVGVTLKDSRDSSGRHRFLPFVPADLLFPKTKDKEFWYWKALMYPQDQGMNCCANDAISFHYIPYREMYVLEYFLYHIRTDGVDRAQEYVQEYPLELPVYNSLST